MSLMRFLSAGKSLVGLKAMNSRYEVTEKRLLPKFVSAKNPFGAGSATSASAPANGAPSEGEKEKAAEVTAQARPVQQAPVSERSASSEPTRILPAKTPTVSGKSGGMWGKCWGWLGRITGTMVPKRKTRNSTRFVAPAVRQPIQGELSLDTVKVVRNDLSDTDVEVVPARTSATKTETAPKVATVEPPPPEPAPLEPALKT